MKPSADKLTAKQEEAIAALLSHATQAKAALAVGVSETTLWRWQQEELFQQAYRQARQQAVDTAFGLLQKASGAATATLLTIMQDAASPASVRLNAAGKVLDFAFRAVEIENVETEIANLQETLQHQQELLEGKKVEAGSRWKGRRR